jgi:hypothetical protein
MSQIGPAPKRSDEIGQMNLGHAHNSFEFKYFAQLDHTPFHSNLFGHLLTHSLYKAINRLPFSQIFKFIHLLQQFPKMAMNMGDKKSLFKAMVPEVEISMTSSGLTLRSKRFHTPRFVPYEATGKCKECRSDTVELDFMVCQQGVTLYCSRITGEKFVKFDKMNELPGYCFFKLRSRGRVFNVVHGNPEAADQTTIKEYMRPTQPSKTTVKEEEIIDLTDSRAPSPIELIDKATKLPVKEEEIIELSNSRAPSPIQTIDATGQEEMDDPVQSFLDSLSAATKFLDIPRDTNLDSRLSSASLSSTSSLGTEEGDPIIRMGKMPWEAEEEEAVANLAKKPKMDNE